MLAILTAALLLASVPAGLRESGIKPPALLHKVEPQYTRAGVTAGVQGNVVLEIVVNPGGKAEQIHVVNPLGFGLDEKAVEAVSQWRFRPGEKDGEPVPVSATVEIRFRLQGLGFDTRTEERRAEYNRAVNIFAGRARGEQEKAAAALVSLAEKKYAPAMHAAGLLYLEGKHVAKDSGKAVALFRAAAARHHGPAMYEIGYRMMSGIDGIEQDAVAGFKMLKDSAVLGSAAAQFRLGELYRTGTEVAEKDLERARHYYRLCASTGTAACQVKLAALLFRVTPREERKVVQAIAWCQLAQDHGDRQAKLLLESERANLREDQMAAAAQLKKRLVEASRPVE